MSGREQYLTGILAAAPPAGTALWVLTNPESGGYYLQGKQSVEVGGDLRFVAPFNLGTDNLPAAGPNNVRLVQVTTETSAYFASCNPTTEVNPRLPGALPWHEVGVLVVLKTA